MPNNLEKDNEKLNEKDTNLNHSEEKKGEENQIGKEEEIKKEKDEKSNEEKESKSSEEKIEKEKEEEKSEKEEVKEKTPEEKREELKSRLSSGMKNPFKEKKGKFSFKGFVMLIFILTVLLSLPTMIADVEKTPSKEISYTEFIKMSENKSISSVEEKDGYVYGYSGEGENIKGFKTRMITDRLGNDVNLVKTLENSDISIKSVPPQELPFILSLLASWFPMLLLIGIWFFMLNRMNKGGGGGPQIFNMGKSKAKENGEEISNTTFKDVAGIDEAKHELQEVVEFLREPEKFRKLGAKIPKGVLLLGSPGTGKTLLAKAVAGEAKVPFFSMSGSEFVEMFVGVGASRVRDLFARARKNAPCIVFIDEIDAVGRKRGSGQGGGNDEREQTLNQLLVEMDGFGNEETIIVIAATNRPDVLDRALRRPGRFDRQVFVDRPDIKGRREILEVHARGKKFADDVNFETVARKTVGLVGADLANILNEAAILAARAGRDVITMADLEEASEKVEMGPEKKSKVVTEAEKLKTAYHEAGHAVINYLYLNDTDPVHKVTIIPRGMAGGYTMSLPNEDRYYYSKEWFINRMKMAYGGRAADELVSGELNTGASSDIQHATSIAHNIVTRYGMNEKFGPILLDGTNEGDMFQSKYYSDITGKEVDEEIIKLVKATYAETIQALKDNRDKLDRLAHALCERETIMQEEFEMLMEGKELPPLNVEKDKKEEVVSENLSEEKVEEVKEEVKEEKTEITSTENEETTENK
ncbi:ATP-dependent zinc metalloprotease FtsH [Fusobacterium sp.]|uniref:ATP-dependent zinc metalloprotease FtsH n=1 Tax=Fusobacterium sp. TaxID=68766 RepID=UPI00261B2C80|nr:ATP-dependent zinc metalloprotease FtsH [Fusobacterium sp.]